MLCSCLTLVGHDDNVMTLTTARLRKGGSWASATVCTAAEADIQAQACAPAKFAAIKGQPSGDSTQLIKIDPTIR